MDKNEPWVLLTERAKELECIYAVDEVLQDKTLTISQAMLALTRAIPPGFTCPQACRARILLQGNAYSQPDFERAKIVHRTPISIDAGEAGHIELGYIKALLGDCDGALLDSEIRLLDTIASHIARLAFYSQREISMLFDMLLRIDPDMLLRICERLRIHLSGLIHDGQRDDIDDFFKEIGLDEVPFFGEVNSPLSQMNGIKTHELIRKLIAGGTKYMSDSELFDTFNRWIRDERAFALVKAVGGSEASISDILDALRQYAAVVGQDGRGNALTETWLVSELAHRFLTDEERLINLVLDTFRIADFQPMLEKIIGSPQSRGHVGGKGAGIFIAQQVLAADPLLADIKTPRTWYIAADHLTDFIHYNHLEELHSYKYNSAEHLRMTYGQVVAKIKSGRLPPYIMKMLSLLLDDLADSPIIVRSSSLLEDRANAAFSGKYKSLFLANQGSKAERLEQITDAILEVYSSMYNPDSIQYRKERGLIHFTERMGILVQEVVGRRIGQYSMPLYSGVAFSENPLRWSARINRESGLVRMVMGLGTRSVDRVNDDYPLLFSPGQPGMRINQSPLDIKRYSQKYIDLINLEKKTFETVRAEDFLKAQGANIPGIGDMISAYTPAQMESKSDFDLDFKNDDMVITFEGLLSKNKLAVKVSHMLAELSKKMDMPVDIEFAHDGKHMYLLQCRAQSRGTMKEPAPVPQQLSPNDLLFSANRFITNARLEGITHIVYVDADAYGDLPSKEVMLDVGLAVGRLCGLLPRRKYILIGPGRWGSRGDIQLGVRVTYSDICNTAALVEVAKEKRGYTPELSFGTHFFQDLVEADIAYLPIYPGQPGVVFKERFLCSADNMLCEVLPQFAHISHVLKVIDVQKSFFGKNLYLYMNADLERGVAFFDEPTRQKENAFKKPDIAAGERWQPGESGECWRWRQYMAERIATEMDVHAYGVRGVYLIGSTNTGHAGMGSDIDLLIHFSGDEKQRLLLQQWLDGWSRALANSNYLKTGYDSDGLLDAHIVTDEDIQKGGPFAIKINSIVDPPTLLRGV